MERFREDGGEGVDSILVGWEKCEYENLSVVDNAENSEERSQVATQHHKSPVRRGNAVTEYSKYYVQSVWNELSHAHSKTDPGQPSCDGSQKRKQLSSDLFFQAGERESKAARNPHVSKPFRRG